jgi:ankyrin repeat protein
VVKILLENRILDLMDVKLLYNVSRKYSTPLQISVRCGHIEAVKLLLQYGMPINGFDSVSGEFSVSILWEKIFF